MASKNYKAIIKAESERLGFCLFGISTVKHMQGYQRYVDWINQNYHTNMAYLATYRALQLRQNPGMVLSGARSITSLGVKYPAPGEFVSAIFMLSFLIWFQREYGGAILLLSLLEDNAFWCMVGA